LNKTKLTVKGIECNAPHFNLKSNKQTVSNKDKIKAFQTNRLDLKTSKFNSIRVTASIKKPERSIAVQNKQNINIGQRILVLNY
jgi:hypothetical protein